MAIAQSGGTVYSNTALAEVKQTVVAGPALLFNITAYNSGNAVSYIQFFDALAANVTVGSTTPTFVIGVPNTGGYDAALTLPEAFRNGIVVACTAGATNNSAPNAAAVVKLSYVGGF